MSKKTYLTIEEVAKIKECVANLLQGSDDILSQLNIVQGVELINGVIERAISDGDFEVLAKERIDLALKLVESCGDDERALRFKMFWGGEE
jgi:hypothetical protein